MRKTLLLLVGVSVIAAIAVVLLTWPNSPPPLKEPPPKHAFAPRGDYFGEKEWAYVASYDKFDDLAAFIRTAPTLTVYEGLPHPGWEQDVYEQELHSTQNKRIAGSDFYATPVSINSKTERRIRDAMTNRDFFIPFQGYKMCGGFHADWCLSWSNKDTTFDILICYGCGEIKVFKNGEEFLYCDIWDGAQIAWPLNPLRTHRPKTKPPFE